MWSIGNSESQGAQHVNYSHSHYDPQAINKKLNINNDLFLWEFVLDHENIMHTCTAIFEYHEKVGGFYSPQK